MKLTQEIRAAQALVNSGAAWRMEGSTGRALMAAIEQGQIMLGPKAVRDYWGNVVPGRDDVKEGTKGSRDYVAAANGEEYADALLDVSNEPLGEGFLNQ